MRRQVKPFVTEYRGSVRRRDPTPSGDGLPEARTPRGRSFAEADRAFHAETVEDSYEAALRAADALFSAVPVGNLERHAAPPAPQSIFDVPNGATDPASQETPPPATVAPTIDRDPMSPPRRILQAIEPQADDRFAALEAERAPKRRGRKPGSKNKPKIVVGDDWKPSAPRSVDAILQALSAADPTPPSPLPASAPVSASVLAVREPTEPEDQLSEDQLPELLQPRGRNDKVRWKREGLRPGERWKRRLPKAAW